MKPTYTLTETLLELARAVSCQDDDAAREGLIRLKAFDRESRLWNEALTMTLPEETSRKRLVLAMLDGGVSTAFLPTTLVHMAGSFNRVDDTMVTLLFHPRAENEVRPILIEAARARPTSGLRRLLDESNPGYRAA
jgi:hypothetical protein